MKQSEHFDSFYPEFKKKHKNNERLHTSDKHIIKTKKQCRNNRRLKKQLIHSFFPNFIKVVKRGSRTK